MSLAASVLGGCGEPGLVVTNRTDRPVQIRLTHDLTILVADIGAHETTRIGLSTGADDCNSDVGYSAYHSTTEVVATLHRACQGDTWTIG
ncbi:hypothetical protein ACFUC1_18570 [Pedococcus sp. NPDC057267]|uniref:hypothetical protein n=1 Tax=Pedococcus sp. NPDC057267 TaxID=3346077 RepID=UPI00362DD8F0